MSPAGAPAVAPHNPPPQRRPGPLGNLLASVKGVVGADSTAESRSVGGIAGGLVAGREFGVATERGRRAFGNGDVFVGSYRTADGVPHGHGMYTWVSGEDYEGEWADGLRHGVGTYRWNSGALYEGEWLEGHIHGVGKLRGSEGSLYVGSWAQNRKHGLGRKTYASGDVYEGIWRDGLPEGPGEYRWMDGSTYSGEWVSGRMEGRGTYVWSSGDRFDGQWKAGVEHGEGAYTWADGSYFEGTWFEGRKRGTGYYIPAVQQAATSAPLAGDETAAAAGSSADGGDRPPEDANDPVMDHSSSDESSDDGDGDAPRIRRRAFTRLGPTTVVRREYQEDGTLENEETLTHEQSKVVLRKLLRYRDRHGREKKKNRSAAKKQGETIYKGHIAYDMMVCIQLGIRFSIGKVTPLPREDVTAADFISRPEDKMDFPRGGSASTPPHPSFDFKWKEYAPMAFRHLREHFDIDAGEYMVSLCGDQALRQLASPGKSGALFYSSHDDRFLIKTVRKHEMKLLRDLLPMYYKHVMENRDTLLTKFFGLYRLKPLNSGGSRMSKAAGGSRTVRFVVMNNLFCTDLRIHRRFDLKGSTQGRATPQEKIAKLDEQTILKDLDLDMSFALEEGKRAKLLRQISIDCALLEELRVMDYSMLLGVHYRDLGKSPLSSLGELSTMSYADRKHMMSKRTSDTEVKTRRETRSLSVTAQRAPQKLSGIRPMAGTEGSSDFLAKAAGVSLVTLGQTMAATALPSLVRFPEPTESPKELDALIVHGHPASEGEAPMPPGACGSPCVVAEPSLGTRDVVLYFGVIDILQVYNQQKRAETAFKGMVHARNTISAVDPMTYSARFQSFMGGVFK